MVWITRRTVVVYLCISLSSWNMLMLKFPRTLALPKARRSLWRWCANKAASPFWALAARFLPGFPKKHSWRDRLSQGYNGIHWDPKVEQHKTHCAHCDRSDHSFKWFLEGTEFPHGCPRDFFLWAQSQGTTCAEMVFACTMKSATAEENEAPGGDSLGRGIQGQFFMGKCDEIGGFESSASSAYPAFKHQVMPCW